MNEMTVVPGYLEKVVAAVRGAVEVMNVSISSMEKELSRLKDLMGPDKFVEWEKSEEGREAVAMLDFAKGVKNG
jgi:hypothetical protein